MKEKLFAVISACLAVLSGLFRFVPHMPNMTPLGTTAIFSGSRLSKPINYMLPLLTMYITDLFLGFHQTMLFVYGSFAITIFISNRFFKNKSSLIGAGTLGLINSTLFFVVTNFGVWLTTAMYPKTFVGLVQCYTMGLPFWRNMAIGDVAFAVGFYALFNLATKFVHKYKFNLEEVKNV